MATLRINGDTSGYVELVPPTSGVGVSLNFPTASDVLVGRNSTDPLSNKTLVSPIFSGTASGAMLPGTLSAGTQATLNPYVVNTTVTTAHGLGAKPNLVITYFECIISEFGYSVGDRIQFESSWVGDSTSSSMKSTCVVVDATNVVILTSEIAAPLILTKTDHTGANLTPTNWKIVATPYKIN